MPQSIFRNATTGGHVRRATMATRMRGLPAWCCALLLAGFAIGNAWAAATASLDRNRIALGESVTLEVRSDAANAPDFAPLRADFALSDTASSRQMEMANGRISSSAVYSVQLTPRRAGALQIPSLLVGHEHTAPLTLTVEASAASAATPASGGGQVGPSGREDVYVQTVVDDVAPYVQQSVGVVLRFYYAVPLASGQLDLDAPAGASLQRVGEDVPGRREIGGRLYNVIERRFLLIPDRSGRLELPAARFTGQGAGGVFSDFFGNGRGELQASSLPRALEVRPVPAGAPQSWLPLRDLRLRYAATPPQAVRAGQAATFSIEAVATGATRAQMPELPVPAVTGAQVFPEAAQYDERFVDGSPVVTVTRRYSVVPARPGRLSVPGIAIDWWSVRDASARTARLPDLELSVAAAQGAVLPATAAAASTALATTAMADAATSATHAVWPWVSLAGVFALLWLATLVWAWRGRRRRAAVSPSVEPASRAPAAPATRTLADLKRALDTAGLAEVGEVLRCMHAPPLADLDAVRAALADPVQRDAVEHLARAQWRDGDVAEARQAMRDAFRQGARWSSAAPARQRDELPPLYPDR
jgi:hypothetical protein